MAAAATAVKGTHIIGLTATSRSTDWCQAGQRLHAPVMWCTEGMSLSSVQTAALQAAVPPLLTADDRYKWFSLVPIHSQCMHLASRLIGSGMVSLHCPSATAAAAIACIMDNIMFLVRTDLATQIWHNSTVMCFAETSVTSAHC